MRNIFGLLSLLRLVGEAGFRVRSAYWDWRMETAVGADRARRPSRGAMRRAALEYGRWVHAMRRMSR